jgi:Fe-S-cluster-containing hydrogenase component 2
MTIEIAKLIDVSACIGCKACQVACMEWNDVRDEVGSCHGVYDNPMDLTAKLVDGDALLPRSSRTGQARVADPQGRLHALFRPRLPEGLPGPGRHHSVRNGIVDFHQENCIGCGYCVTGCPFNVPRISKEGQQGLQVHAVFRPGGGQPGAGLREGLPDRRHPVRQQGRHEGLRRQAHYRPEGARLRQGRPVRSARRRRHARHVRAAPRRQARSLSGLPANPSISPLVRCGRASPSRSPRWLWPASRWAACSTT